MSDYEYVTARIRANPATPPVVRRMLWVLNPVLADALCVLCSGGAALSIAADDRGSMFTACLCCAMALSYNFGLKAALHSLAKRGTA